MGENPSRILICLKERGLAKAVKRRGVDIMAKKGNRILVGLVCSVCGRRNYVTDKNKVNSPGKITIRKYCPNCRKLTIHKETDKLK